MRIGLLGGSFNPPHAGHRAISIAALKDLQLDFVWWLVSPQNPLKSPKGLLPLTERVKLSRHIARHPRIKVVDIEKRLPDNYTITTIRFLKRAYPRDDFFWIMGADNLKSFHHWRCWKDLFYLLPIIVYDRADYLNAALSSRASRTYNNYRVSLASLRKKIPPAWSVVINRKNPLSSTSLREEQ